MEFPFITVVMPIRNEEKHILEVINELLLQDYPSDRFEIIVADGKSTDSTREIIREIKKKDRRVRLFSNSGVLPSSGRNMGFRYGRGDIFIVIDGHCRINNSGYLRAVAECFERSGAQCLGRPQPFIEPEEPSTAKAIALVRKSPFGHSRHSFIHSTEECFASPVSMGCAYRREVFERIGYVDESFDACEDVEFNYRVEQAGFRTFFSPKVEVFYYPRNSLFQLGRQMLRYGVGRYRFVMKHKEAFRPEMLVPVLFCAGLFLGPFLAMLSPYLLAAYIGLVLAFACMITAESVRLGGRYGFIFTGKMVAAFTITYIGLGLGIFKGAMNQFRNGFERAGTNAS